MSERVTPDLWFTLSLLDRKCAVCLTLRYIFYTQCRLEVKPSLMSTVPDPKIYYILLLGQKIFRMMMTMMMTTTMMINIIIILRSETEKSTKRKQFECFYLY